MRVILEGDLVLNEALKKYFQFSSSSKIKKILKNQCIKVNDEVIKLGSHLLHKGDILDYNRFRPGADTETPFKVYFEDEYYVIIEKPPGILTVANDKEKEKNVLKLLQNYFKNTTHVKNKFKRIKSLLK